VSAPRVTLSASTLRLLFGPAQPPTRRRRARVRVVRVPVHPVAALVAAFEARARGVRS
jgi:hypothetical protein